MYPFPFIHDFKEEKAKLKNLDGTIVLKIKKVNYKVDSYHLHHISIRSLTFQLCQFGPQPF